MRICVYARIRVNNCIKLCFKPDLWQVTLRCWKGYFPIHYPLFSSKSIPHYRRLNKWHTDSLTSQQQPDSYCISSYNPAATQGFVQGSCGRTAVHICWQVWFAHVRAQEQTPKHTQSHKQLKVLFHSNPGLAVRLIAHTCDGDHTCSVTTCHGEQSTAVWSFSYHRVQVDIIAQPKVLYSLTVIKSFTQHAQWWYLYVEISSQANNVIVM